jgi:hypothetical protein
MKKSGKLLFFQSRLKNNNKAKTLTGTAKAEFREP